MYSPFLLVPIYIAENIAITIAIKRIIKVVTNLTLNFLNIIILHLYILKYNLDFL